MKHWLHNNRNTQLSGTHPKDPYTRYDQDVEASLNKNEKKKSENEIITGLGSIMFASRWISSQTARLSLLGSRVQLTVSTEGQVWWYFWGFSRFSNSILTTLSTFQSPHFMSYILVHSFRGILHLIHGNKEVQFVTPPVYNHTCRWGWSGAHCMAYSSELWAWRNIVKGRIGRELLIILRPRTQLNTDKMILG